MTRITVDKQGIEVGYIFFSWDRIKTRQDFIWYLEFISGHNCVKREDIGAIIGKVCRYRGWGNRMFYA